MPSALRLVCCVLALSCSGLSPANAEAPGQQHGFCYGLAGNPRVNNFTPVFPVGSTNQASLAQSGFINHLHQRYGGYTTQEYLCQFFATEAEAQRQRQQLMDEGRKYPAWPVVEIDWTPKAPAQPAAKPAAPAAAPPANAAPAAAAAKPPAKPALPPAKAAVYVICRSEFNTDLRRFYNPPIEGRGAGYPEWQASYRAYLVSHHKFRGENLGCGKYPTKAAAQADYDAWVSNAHATPSINGQPSPVIITDWQY